MTARKNTYSTQLQAGLGLVSETKLLLDMWAPGMSPAVLEKAALVSGTFPTMTARRLSNLIGECFAPRYLVENGTPAVHLKRLVDHLDFAELAQLMLIFTCRANLILGDFVRTVFWDRYAGGYTNISNEDASRFVRSAIDDGKTSTRWSDSTIRRMSAYLTGCCADYGLLERGTRSVRQIKPVRLAPRISTYLAYDLHFRGTSDNALLTHPDWQLFGMDRQAVREDLKRLALKDYLIVQAAGDVVTIAWKYPTMEALCDVLAKG